MFHADCSILTTFQQNKGIRAAHHMDCPSIWPTRWTWPKAQPPFPFMENLQFLNFFPNQNESKFQNIKILHKTELYFSTSSNLNLCAHLLTASRNWNSYNCEKCHFSNLIDQKTASPSIRFQLCHNNPHVHDLQV